jgi:hypothetical protein
MGESFLLLPLFNAGNRTDQSPKERLQQVLNRVAGSLRADLFCAGPEDSLTSSFRAIPCITSFVATSIRKRVLKAVWMFLNFSVPQANRVTNFFFYFDYFTFTIYSTEYEY